jgi:hypothetical protein
LPAHFHFRASYLYLLGLDRYELEAEFRLRGICHTPRVTEGLRAQSTRRRAPRASQEPEVAIEVILRVKSARNRAYQDFDLWRVDGERSIEHLGTHLRLAIRRRPRTVRVDLPAVISHGDRIALALPCGRGFGKTLRAAVSANAALEGKRRILGYARRPPPQQLLLMRAVIALDAHLAGASYREIAQFVFGTRAVRKHWSSNPALKEQARYLVRKGRSLMSRANRKGVNFPARDLSHSP